MVTMEDPFMKLLGLEARSDSPGTARVRGRVLPEHLNLHGTTHGGFLYTLADTAFALAANSHGVPAVALATHMDYLQPGKPGEEVEAVAGEVHLGRSTGVYRIEVRGGDRLLATFTGTVFRKQTTAESANTAKENSKGAN
ncbi:MAG: hydroxyphenylacetyl-CoA thioesterase PaaI [Anaerolineales bacterium]|nr:hydroxyphenylacetyl-CoA thioesterase PaaI [Anaerolineales bacterium]